MAKHYELTPLGFLAVETQRTPEDTRLLLHSVKRYLVSRKKNAIIFKNNGDVIFAKVQKRD